MHARSIGALFIIVLFAWTATAVEAVKPEDNRQTQEKGRRVYERACLWCHGAEGKGDGPAGWFVGRYSAPYPRDLTSEGFKFRSTPSGQAPTDQDLFRTVTRGIPGFMPSFSSLTEEERWQVIAYIKSLNPLFKEEKQTPLAIPIPPFSPSDVSIETGRNIYLQFGCQGCHGENGKGDGVTSQAGELRDGRGFLIQSTDLTKRPSFKNGADPRDIYRTLMTGLDGTPMPSYAHSFDGREEDVWHLVNYLVSLSGDPRP
jgi:mono/diheme cytochrome c family protein